MEQISRTCKWLVMAGGGGLHSRREAGRRGLPFLPRGRRFLSTVCSANFAYRLIPWPIYAVKRIVACTPASLPRNGARRGASS